MGLAMGLATLGAVALVCALGGASVSAQSPPQIASAEQALRHGSSDEATGAIDRLERMRGSRAAAQALTESLTAGLPDALTVRALQALAKLRVRATLETFATFATHRRFEVRLAAYRGMITLAQRDVGALLEAGLSDSDPRVRGLCADGLASLGATRALDTLLLALARGVPEAARAIGELGDASTVEAYGAHLERQPMATMLKGYWAFLARRELPEDAKLAIVARLQEVATPTVRRFFQRIYVAVNWRRQPRVKRAIEQAIARIPGGAPGATPVTGAQP